MKALLRLLSALAVLIEEACEAGLVRELALYLRNRRLQAAAAALEMQDSNRARALRDGDHATLASITTDLERALDDAGVDP